MPVWLVTGGSGFLGRHLLGRLGGEGAEVVAIGRRRPMGGRFVAVDLDDRPAVVRAVAEEAPDVVFHLAGRTPPAGPEDFYRSNTMGTVHLLDALRARARPCRVVLVGSAAELGPVGVEDLPVGEDHPCRPADAYGLSKWLASAAGLAAGLPLEVVVARVFNPIGPGLPGSQALGRFAGALASGSGPIRLTVGDLGARRDFVDARDVAGALVALASRGRPGRVYHVGTGQSHGVGDGLDRLIALSGREVAVEVDPAVAGSRGPGDSRADVRRIAEEAGWSAAIPWEQSLGDLWDDARARAGRG
jgi:nucleoside-diphosphate-sugar epimerase